MSSSPLSFLSPHLHFHLILQIVHCIPLLLLKNTGHCQYVQEHLGENLSQDKRVTKRESELGLEFGLHAFAKGHLLPAERSVSL